MPAKARREVIDESEVGVYHLWGRTVRRAFLIGKDPVTGRDYSHRKDVFEKRLELLLSLFSIECLDSAALDNHIHLIVRNRPDLAALLTDWQVAERWLRLKRGDLDLLAPPTRMAIDGLVANAKKLRKIRRRLSSISWFMAYLREPLAKRFNFEDKVSGCFWAGRFGAERLTTETSL